MKRTAIIGLCLLFSVFAFCQKPKSKPIEAKQDTTLPPNVDGPKGTVIFVMTPDQVALLEYVISKTDAGFEKTNALIQILKTQQYNPPATISPADTVARPTIISPSPPVGAAADKSNTWHPPVTKGDSTVKKN